MKQPKRSYYHFSLGNSTKGAVGFCATVRAHSKVEAVQILANALPEEYNIPNNGADYVTVYFNPKALRVAHIDDVTDMVL